MNKKNISVIVAIVFVAGGAIAYVAAKPDKQAKNEDVAQVSMPKSQTDKSASQSSVLPSDTTTTAVADEKPGVYAEYSDTSIKSTAGTKLIFFHAPWCSQCRQIEASINKDGVPAGVTVLKADYDSNQDLRKKYGVTLQTTFVKVDDNGDKISSYVAYEEPNFSSVRRELLQ